MRVVVRLGLGFLVLIFLICLICVVDCKKEKNNNNKEKDRERKNHKVRDDDEEGDEIKSCPYAKYFNVHGKTQSAGDSVNPSEHYHKKKSGTEEDEETDDTTEQKESVVSNCPAFKEGCPFSDFSKYSSEQIAELVKQCPMFKDGCPFKKNAETGELSLNFENCPAFKDGCPFTNMSEWTEEQKAQIEKCPLFKKGCPFNGKCPFDNSKDHKNKEKKKEKKDKVNSTNLLANYVTALSSALEDESLWINMLSDNVRGSLLVGSQPPKVLQGKEQAVAWLKSINSDIVSQNMQWLDLQFVKESSRIYSTRKITVNLKSGKPVEFYVSSWSELTQGKITEFEIVSTVDRHSVNHEQGSILSSETEKLI